MTGIFRNNTRVENAAEFIDRFGPAGAPDNYLYAIIGREDDPQGTDSDGVAYGAGAGTWTDDNLPPDPTDTVEQDENVWNFAIGGKKVDPLDVYPIVPRRDWVSGDTYVAFDESSAGSMGSAFYVMNNLYEVFECVVAGAGASTTKPIFSEGDPTGPSTQLVVDSTANVAYYDDGTESIFNALDGYSWKYLYTVTPPSVTDRLQQDWLPVNYGDSVWATDTEVQSTESREDIAYRILGARYVLIRIEMEAGADGSGLLPAGLNYRQISYVQNPLDDLGAQMTAGVGYMPNTINGAVTDFEKYSGRVLYVENRSPIFRQADQTEESKVIITF